MAIHAYQEIYLNNAQKSLGDAFDYAINTCGISGSDFVKMFTASSISKRIENGEPALLAGRSGFEIAKKDLELRGPGDFFGAKQHGVLEFKIANLKRDFNLAVICKKEAEKILEEDEHLNMEKNASIKFNVAKFFSSNFTIL